MKEKLMQNENWIKEFTKQNGRKPRILHVGNINNNAYQIAKMLNAAGASCDVLCADYYYIMANPEWDDAEIIGDVGSKDFPALHKVNLNGFVRPLWFAQAPRKLAIAYLIAYRTGKICKAKRLWRKMENSRKFLVFKENSCFKPILNKIQLAKNLFCIKLEYLRSAAMELVFSPNIFYYRLKKRFAKLTSEQELAVKALDNVANARARLEEDAKKFYPDREFYFGAVCDDYLRTAAIYEPLFKLYDIVQAYATDPVWPYLTGHTNYVAWEHGTLRDTPYEDNDLSRLCLLAYAAAKVVYVTNVDCYESAVYITTKSKAPIVCGLHGFDTLKMLEKQEQAQKASLPAELLKSSDLPLFFCPARIDIDPHYGTYLKKNDLLFRALARLWESNKGKFRVLQLDSGQDVATLKKLIHDEIPNMESAVIWHEPFQKAEYYQILQHSTLVFDNLLLPLMSGNGIETLMSGHAALVNKRIPQELMLRFFGEMWPVLEIDEEDDVYAAAEMALKNPAACKTLAKNAKSWVLKHHSPSAIVQKHMQAFWHAYPLSANK